MADFYARDIRNVALIGHSGEGKTTLAEAILFNAGALDRQGKVDDGNTTMDFDAEEIAKKISISLSVANCTYNGVKFNLIDVPGYFDFDGEKLQALSVAGSAIIVTSASGSLSVGTEKALDYCIEHKIPALLFVNGVDKDNANFGRTVEAIEAKYKKVAPVIVPEFVNNKMVGYCSVVSGKYFPFGSHGQGGEEIPANLMKDYNLFRDRVVEVAAESDDELMMKFFDGQELTNEEVNYGISEGLLKGITIPVLGGSALANKGIFNLMNIMVQSMPHAAHKAEEATNEAGDTVSLTAEDGEQTVLRVFKTITDPFVGRLSLFRVITGTLSSGVTLHNANKECDEKLSTIYTLRGKKQEPAAKLFAGDIGAVAKLTHTTTGDTLYSDSFVKLPPIQMPSPVYSMAVYAGKKGDEDKIFGGLNKLKDEDISFSVNKDLETGEMLLSGVGDTQLDMLVRKLKNKFGCEAVLQEPRIAYRESIRKCVEAEGKHKKQSGGAGQFGHCKVRFEPGASDGEFEFVDAVVGGAVPRQFIPAVEKGLREAVVKGVLAGYPMVNLKCTLFDGSYHPVDSKEIAFKMAAGMAYKDGCAKASPTILEPIYEMNIIVPDDYLGDIMGDMNKRRGRIQGTESNEGKQHVVAEAPLGEILKYATDLRSMTQGRGSYSIKFSRYEEVPAHAVDKIVADAKSREE